MVDILVNFVSYIIGLPAGFFILWEVLIQPIIKIATLGDIIVVFGIAGMFVLVLMLSDKILEIFLNNKEKDNYE